MACRQNEWVKRKRAELIEEFGGKCAHCGSQQELEFAHTRPTGLNGMGRGRNHRILDIRRNRDAYLLLCRPCHRKLDAPKGFSDVEDCPF